MRYLIGVSVACAMLTLPTSSANAQQGPFRFQEATIASIHAALAAGQLTCTQLTRLYLDRIAAYNTQGPALHAIITVNPKAMEIAAEMDRSYRASPASAGALHCIPIVLKDSLRQYQSARLANMQEFARGGMSISSLGGQVRNPYDLDRTPGGSSGGTGAAIAANFAVVGTGSDTGQSVRSPASANSLVASARPAVSSTGPGSFRIA
jgi:amidase